MPPSRIDTPTVLPERISPMTKSLTTSRGCSVIAIAALPVLGCTSPGASPSSSTGGHISAGGSSASGETRASGGTLLAARTLHLGRSSKRPSDWDQIPRTSTNAPGRRQRIRETRFARRTRPAATTPKLASAPRAVVIAEATGRQRSSTRPGPCSRSSRYPSPIGLLRHAASASPELGVHGFRLRTSGPVLF